MISPKPTFASQHQDISDALSSTSLEPPETKPEQPEELPGGVTCEPIGIAESFRHSGWAHNRSLVYSALRRTNQPTSRIAAFHDCGAFAYVYQTAHAPYEYRLGGSNCHDRFCLPCASDRSRLIAGNVLDALGGKPARFLTLTLKSNDGPLSTQIDRLYSCFAVLRNRKLWRSRVQGGCAFTEIKWSTKAKAWNVHIHCIIHGLFLPQRELSAAWFRITGDSMILDIRLIRDQGHVGRYVTKYASKPLSNTFVNRKPQFDEVIQAMHGRRLCFTFGTWRGIKLTEAPEPGEWINLGSFESVVLQAKQGDLEALRALRYIAGDRAESILQSVNTPRAPPDPHNTQPKQTLFGWNLHDFRF